MSDNQNIPNKTLPEVTNYETFLNPARRENTYYDEFGLDIDTFENLIDNFNPEEDIILCLAKDRKTLDAFCQKVYGMNFHQTYERLSGISKSITRMVYNKLAKVGNPTAMNIQQSYACLAKQYEDAKPISIIMDIKSRDSEDKK